MIADGKVYALSGDHDPAQPMVEGEHLYCFNSETGELLWAYPMQGGSTPNAGIGDGLLIWHDSYTGYLNCFGTGKTAVEVTTSKSQVAEGEYTWISGRVTDQSPAQMGTGCVSDESMGPWMEYLHASKPEPAMGTITGVDVTLRALDSSNTLIDIGTITADGEGYFSHKWTPPDEDQYRIMAYFEGTDSYFESYGMSNLAVGPAAADFPTPAEISSKVIADMPDYPTPPTASQISSQVVADMPDYPTPPTPPTASQISSQVVTDLPAFPDNSTLIIVVLVVAIVGLCILLYGMFTGKK
jgi:hypothetical protein